MIFLSALQEMMRLEPAMRKMLRLTKREYFAVIKTKGFIAMLILLPILMSGGFIAKKISESRIDTSDKKIAVIDHSSVMAEALVDASEQRNKTDVFDTETGKKQRPSYPIEILTPNTAELRKLRLELSDRIRNGDLHAFVEIGADVIHPGADRQASRVAYHSKNSMTDDVRGWVEWPINNRLRSLRLSDAGIDESEVKDLFHWVAAEGLGLATLNEETGELVDAERTHGIEAIGIPIFMIMTMYMMILIGAQPLLMSVMEEKTQKIAEVILGAIGPFEFMMGKILGIVGVTLTAASFYMIAGIISLNIMGYSKYINYSLLPWYFTYLILALLMYGSVNAALGATCNDSKDVQSVAFPALIPLISCMFMMGPVLKEPMSEFATIVSLLPPFTPLIMMLRQSVPGGVPVWQPWLGVSGMLLFTVFLIWIGGRIFRISILMQGKSLKLKNIIKWGLRG